MTGKKQESKLPKISDAEWEVVRVLWAKGECTATNVYEELVGDFDWSPKTVRTFLARLVEKSVVAVENQGKINHYKSLIDEETTKKIVGKSFLKKFFSGALPSMIVHFVDDENVTLDELSELQKVIDSKRAELKKSQASKRKEK